MATFGGFIASALGGAAKGYGEGAQMEMKKQAELDLKKQLMEAELEKASRLDEIKRGRDVAEEDRKLGPAYLAKVNDADLIRATGAIANRTALAPLAAGADVAEGTAKAGTRTQLAGVNAAAAEAEGKAAADVEAKLAIPRSYADAAVRTAKSNMNVLMAPIEATSEKYVYQVQKELSDLKLKDATDDQIKKAKALVADTGYMEALIKTNRAMHQHLIDIANIKATSAADTSEDRLEGARLKSAGKEPGGGGAEKGLDLARAETSAQKALARALEVEDKEANVAYGALKRKADKGDLDAKAKLAKVEPLKKRLEEASAEWENRKKAKAAPAAAASGAAASSFTPAMPPGFKGAAPPPPSKFKLD